MYTSSDGVGDWVHGLEVGACVGVSVIGDGDGKKVSGSEKGKCIGVLATGDG